MAVANWQIVVAYWLLLLWAILTLCELSSRPYSYSWWTVARQVLLVVFSSLGAAVALLGLGVLARGHC
jgi:hypothetical protein